MTANITKEMRIECHTGATAQMQYSKQLILILLHTDKVFSRSIFQLKNTRLQTYQIFFIFSIDSNNFRIVVQFLALFD